MNRFAVLVPVFLLLVIVPSTRAQDLVRKLDETVSAMVAAKHFNGAVLVTKGETVLLRKGYGTAVFEWNIPVTPETRFRIGSVTKQFTAAMILRLMEHGKLELDVPFRKYIPDYPSSHADQVTIHQLLTHTSGIPSYTEFPGFMRAEARREYPPDSMFARIAPLPLVFEPGSAWSYNNSGYFILGAVIERITGMSYDRALRAMLLDPLGLRASGYEHNGDVIPDFANGYIRLPVGVRRAAWLDTSVPYAAGMMYSTVDDLVHWTRALHAGQVFASTETLTKMITPYMENYGYGLSIHEQEAGEKRVRVIEHGGGIFGFRSALWYLPEEEYTIAVLDNTEGHAGGVATTIFRVLHGLEPEFPKPSIANAVHRIIEEEGLDVVARRYAAMRTEEAETWNFEEQELNSLGYIYLRDGRTDAALRVFKLNVDAYPASWNVYDSYGEALAAAGRKDEAITQYRKALEINPASTSAKQALARLGVTMEEVKITVSEEVLDRHVGRYQLAPNFILAITREGTQLYAQATGQQKIEIHPSSEQHFYLTVVDARITFDQDGEKPSPGLTLHQGGRDMPAKRIQ